MMAFILLGSTLIPCIDIIKSSNIPEVTAKTHFFGFSLTLCSNNL